MRPLPRRLLGGLIWLVLLVVLGLAGGWLWLRQSLPVLDGTLEVAGLEAPVTIVRDAHAVPHIEAASFKDAVFAEGFVHAQDRLWQMDFRRRVGAGRLAEVLGPAALPSRGAPGAVDNGAWTRLYVFQRYTSIGAGTTEVQKNIIADKAIKMPRT